MVETTPLFRVSCVVAGIRIAGTTGGYTDQEGDEAAGYDEHEEETEAQFVGQPAGHHAGKHHAQGLECRAKAEDGGGRSCGSKSRY